MNVTSDLYREGDVIGGDYVVQGILGKGGFGIVYVVRDQRTGEVVALKTFRDEFLPDPRARDAFQKEALLWVSLDKHPFILEARWVKLFSGRLFVAMEHVAPDSDGRVNLSDYLQKGRPIATERAVDWAVQFCLGMEHANSRGIKCHRDIKPTNILLSQGVLKISDFGLAAAEVPLPGAANQRDSLVTGDGASGFGFGVFRTERGMRCGTPGYMPPEVYLGESADQRSDIYSFGLVLWQMATGCASPPFVGVFRGDIEAYLREAFEQQMKRRVAWLAGPMEAVIERCLNPRPSNRFSSFQEVRGALEPIMLKLTGTLITVYPTGHQTAGFWNNKGISLAALGQRDEAIACYDRALAVDPQNVKVWSNKGVALTGLGKHKEALDCYSEALAIDSRLAGLWSNMGNSQVALGCPEEAIRCYDKALAIDPQDPTTWNSLGSVLTNLGRNNEAIGCFDAALATDPRYSEAWNNKGSALENLGNHGEAINCYENALTINPRYAQAWYNKGLSFAALERQQEAIGCYDTALSIDAQDVATWFAKGNAFDALGQLEDAIVCYCKALRIDPRHAEAWNNRGGSLLALGKHKEAKDCYDKAVAIEPRDATRWFNKAYAEDQMGTEAVAVESYKRFLSLALPQHAQQITYAQKRIQVLEGDGRV